MSLERMEVPFTKTIRLVYLDTLMSKMGYNQRDNKYREHTDQGARLCMVASFFEPLMPAASVYFLKSVKIQRNTLSPIARLVLRAS